MHPLQPALAGLQTHRPPCPHAHAGGQLYTPEADGSECVPEFRLGDMCLFVSHKYHNVKPVTSGRRRVLVVELWEGVEKTCAHRCVTAGDCPYTLERGHLAKCMENLRILG